MAKKKATGKEAAVQAVSSTSRKKNTDVKKKEAPAEKTATGKKTKKAPASSRAGKKAPAKKTASVSAAEKGGGKTLLIVESPTKAKTLTKILGSKYIVKSSVGHIRDLPKSRLAIDLDNDFAPEYILVKGKAKVKNRK